MTVTPFSLRIFVADGDPDGLRVVERSNWIGKALVFPRALLPRVKARDKLGQTRVYLLLGPREDSEGEMLRIGQGDRRLSIVREVEAEVETNLKRAQALRQSVLRSAFAIKATRETMRPA